MSNESEGQGIIAGKAGVGEAQREHARGVIRPKVRRRQRENYENICQANNDNGSDYRVGRWESKSHQYDKWRCGEQRPTERADDLSLPKSLWPDTLREPLQKLDSD